MRSEHAVEHGEVVRPQAREVARVHVRQYLVVALHADAPAQGQIVELRRQGSDLVDHGFGLGACPLVGEEDAAVLPRLDVLRRPWLTVAPA